MFPEQINIAPVALVGGTGYLGSHLAQHLHSQGLPYWIVGRQAAAPAHSAGHPYRPARPDLDAAITGARTVVHLASLSTPALAERDPTLETQNLCFTDELLSACRRQKIEHLVFASSGGTIYGDTSDHPARETDPPKPSGAYAATKLAAELRLAQAAGSGHFTATALRFSNVYGGSQRTKGDQGVISYLLTQLHHGHPIRLLGDTVRDYLHINDACRAFHCAIQRPAPGFSILNIATASGTRLTSLTGLLMEFTGQSAPIIRDPPRSFDLAHSVLANAAAEQCLGWTPRIPLAHGLRLAIQEFQAHTRHPLKSVGRD